MIKQREVVFTVNILQRTYQCIDVDVPLDDARMRITHLARLQRFRRCDEGGRHEKVKLKRGVVRDFFSYA